MIYCCIECQKYWCSKEKYQSLDISLLNLETLKNLKDISHGLCPECLSKREVLIHRHQRNKGYSECFNRNDDCNNIECMFKSYCGYKSIEVWKDTVAVLAK